MFHAAIYRPADGRPRWAVYCDISRVWYFPTRYGREAARKLASRLNQQVK